MQREAPADPLSHSCRCQPNRRDRGTARPIWSRLGNEDLGQRATGSHVLGTVEAYSRCYRGQIDSALQAIRTDPIPLIAVSPLRLGSKVRLHYEAFLHSLPVC